MRPRKPWIGKRALDNLGKLARFRYTKTLRRSNRAHEENSIELMMQRAERSVHPLSRNEIKQLANALRIVVEEPDSPESIAANELLLKKIPKQMGEYTDEEQRAQKAWWSAWDAHHESARSAVPILNFRSSVLGKWIRLIREPELRKRYFRMVRLLKAKSRQ